MPCSDDAKIAAAIADVDDPIYYDPTPPPPPETRQLVNYPERDQDDNRVLHYAWARMYAKFPGDDQFRLVAQLGYGKDMGGGTDQLVFQFPVGGEFLTFVTTSIHSVIGANGVVTHCPPREGPPSEPVRHHVNFALPKAPTVKVVNTC